MATSRFARISSLLYFVLCLTQSALLLGQTKELTPKELIAKHLRSIGKPEALTAIKARGMTGKAAVKFIQGGTGTVTDGQFTCVSEGRNLGMKMDFKDINYPGEYFAYNGKETTVRYMKPGQRSPIADFIFLNNAIMKEGLLGGILSVAWPLLRSPEQFPEMHYKLEQVDNVPFHILEYGSSKELDNVRVKLYFDAKTFQHVRTDYSVRIKNDASSQPSLVSGGGQGSVSQDLATRSKPDARAANSTIQGNQPDSIYLLTEKFSNFVGVGGLALPQDYMVEYSFQGQSTFLAQWAVFIEHWIPSGKSPVDPSFFVAQK